jgi:hypothetical protein
MAEAAGPGIESSMHSASRIEGLAELNFRAMKDFNWIAAGVFELQDFKHMTLDRFIVGADTILDAGLGQLVLHFPEFIRPRHPKPQILQVVTAVGMNSEPVVPIIHAQIVAAGFAVVGQFKADSLSGKLLPCVGVIDAESDIAQFSDLNHLDLPRCIIIHSICLL